MTGCGLVRSSSVVVAFGVWLVAAPGPSACACDTAQKKDGAPIAELWVDPGDLTRRDAFHGPGGPESLPSTDTELYRTTLPTGFSSALGCPQVSHRLLRESGGFEGFVRSGEVSEPKRHAVLELNQPSMRVVHPDTALFPANSDPAEDNNTVARVAPLVRDELPLPELLINLLHPSMQSLSPLKRLGLEAAEDLEIGVQLFRRKVPIASVPAFEPGLNQLHVLLRHRPRIIARVASGSGRCPPRSTRPRGVSWFALALRPIVSA